MEKEYLSIENIAKDLEHVAYERIRNMEEWRFRYIIPITTLALTIGIILKNVWIGLVIFSFAAYHIVRYIIDSRYCRTERKQVKTGISRGDISITVVKLSHIAEQTIYEPHFVGKHTREYKIVNFFYFNSVGSWRMPEILKFYKWSPQHSISPQGLINTSVEGNEFYYIELRDFPDISYIYPCKSFKLGYDLRKYENVTEEK